MPFVHLPTERPPNGGSRSIDAGLLVPMAWFGWPALGGWEGLGIEWTPGFAAVRGMDTNRHVFEFSSQLVFNQEVTDGIIPFFEFSAAVTSERRQEWLGVLGVGITFEPTDDLVIEPAVHFGVTDAADDLVVSLTIVLRF